MELPLTLDGMLDKHDNTSCFSKALNMTPTFVYQSSYENTVLKIHKNCGRIQDSQYKITYLPIIHM